MAVTTSRINNKLQPGTSLKDGAFVLEGYLAEGGFGVTYRAHDIHKRRVVIKECFPAGLSRREENTHVTPASESDVATFDKCVRLFLKEAETLRLIKAENVVSVIDVFEERGTAYMVMPFVDGPDFQTVIDKVPDSLTPDYLLHFAVHLLEAVEQVHATGILHRDIKPGNILINPDEKPVIIDFGAARVEATQQSATLSQSLRVVADGYSPNEFYIRGVEQGPASDLYSVAATLWSAIKGHAPPPAPERNQALAESKADPLEPLSGGPHPGFDPRFLELIDQSLSLARRDRIQNASEWLRELRPLLLAPVQIAAPDPAPQPEPEKRGFPVAASLVGLVAGVGLMAMGVAASDGVASSLGRGSASFPPDIMALADSARDAEREAANLSRQLRSAQSTNASQAQQIANLNQQLTNSAAEQTNLQSQLSSAQGNIRNLQNELARGVNETRNRDREIERVTTELNSRAAQIATLQSSLSQSQAVTNDLQRQLNEARSGQGSIQQQVNQLQAQLEAARAETARAQQTLNQTNTALAQAQTTIRQRDQQIAALSDQSGNNAQLAQLNATIRTLQTQLESARADAARAQQTANQTSTALAQAQTTIRQREQEIANLSGTNTQVAGLNGTIRDLQTQVAQLNTRNRQLENEVNGLRTRPQAPTSDLVSALTNPAQPVTRPVQPAAPTPQGTAGSLAFWQGGDVQSVPLRLHTEEINDLAFSPDGSRLVSVSSDNTTQVWDAVTGQRLRVLRETNKNVNGVAYSPDGSFFVTIGDHPELQVWNSQSMQIERRIPIGADIGHSVAVGAGGNLIAAGVGEGDLRVWNRNGQVVAQTRGHNDWISTVDFSPDGQFLASGGLDNAVRVWNARNLSRAGDLAGHRAWLAKVTFAPDGQGLLSVDEEGNANLSVQSGGGWQNASSRALTNGTLSTAAFLPSNDGLISVRTGRGNAIELTDTQLNSRRDLGQQPGASGALAVSPDGRRAAVGASDGTVQLLIRQ